MEPTGINEDLQAYAAACHAMGWLGLVGSLQL